MTKIDGYTLTELALSSVIFTVGALGFASAVTTSQSMRRAASEVSDADAALKDYVQKFRHSCTKDFDATVTEFKSATFSVHELPGADGGFAKVTTQLILDENKLNPPLDLNGNGVFTDSQVLPSQLKLAVVQMKIAWMSKGGLQVREATAYVVRNGLTTGASMLVETGSVTGGGGGGTTGGTGDGTTSDPSGTSVTVSSASVGGQGDVLTASLLVNAPADLQVVGMTIDSSVAAYVSTIQVDGTMLFDVRTDLAPTGSMIKTTPMSLSGSGTVNIDKIDFADTITNQGTPSLSGTTVGITLHLEDGSTVPFKIGL